MFALLLFPDCIYSMPLATSSVRELLGALVGWAQSRDSDTSASADEDEDRRGLAGCARALADALGELAEHGPSARRYCAYLLPDYIDAVIPRAAHHGDCQPAPFPHLTPCSWLRPQSRDDVYICKHFAS
eukprot:scaffold463600_cov39-Prasinocladus_malaysianus.AAC.1